MLLRAINWPIANYVRHLNTFLHMSLSFIALRHLPRNWSIKDYRFIYHQTTTAMTLPTWRLLRIYMVMQYHYSCMFEEEKVFLSCGQRSLGLWLFWSSTDPWPSLECKRFKTRYMWIGNVITYKCINAVYVFYTPITMYCCYIFRHQTKHRNIVSSYQWL